MIEFLKKLFKPWEVLTLEERKISLQKKVYQELINCNFYGNAKHAMLGEITFEQACYNALNCHLLKKEKRAILHRYAEDCARLKI